MELEQAFQSAKDVLAFFSLQSPQAAHYLEILTSLSTTIATRRSRAKATGPSPYVTKLFNLDSSSREESNSDPELAWKLLTIGDACPPGDMKTPGDSTVWPQAQSEVPDFDIDWQSLNISQWDSFPFLSETTV
jgi:hypothetical protein